MMSFIELFTVFGAINGMFAAADIMQKRYFFAITAWSLQFVFQVEK